MRLYFELFEGNVKEDIFEWIWQEIDAVDSNDKQLRCNYIKQQFIINFAPYLSEEL